MKPVYYMLMILLFGACSKSNVELETPENKPEQRTSFVENTPPVLGEIKKKINNYIGGYYQALPAKYKESGLNYPVIIFVHGMGQAGNGNSDLPLLLTEGLGKLIKEKKFPANFSIGSSTHSFIVLLPQFSSHENLGALDGFIDYAMKTYRVDKSRVYLAGLSMGGRMISNYAADYPGKVTAVVPMAGVSKQDDYFQGRIKSIVSSKLPFWVIHNRNDEMMPLEDAEFFVSGINKLSPPVAARLSILSPAGTSNHDAWTRGCDPSFRQEGKNIYEWMLGYTR